MYIFNNLLRSDSCSQPVALIAQRVLRQLHRRLKVFLVLIPYAEHRDSQYANLEAHIHRVSLVWGFLRILAHENLLLMRKN